VGMNSTQQPAPTQKAVLNDLRDYGLLWQRKVRARTAARRLLLTPSSQPSSRRFYRTRLATTLTSSSPPLPTSTGPSSGSKEPEGLLTSKLTPEYMRIQVPSVLLVRSVATLTKFAPDNPLQMAAVRNLFVALK
jgi:hypothetical protein